MNAKYIACALFCAFLAPAEAKFYDGQQLYLYAQEYKKAEQGGRSTPDSQLQAGVFIRRQLVLPTGANYSGRIL